MSRSVSAGPESSARMLLPWPPPRISSVVLSYASSVATSSFCCCSIWSSDWSMSFCSCSAATTRLYNAASLQRTGAIQYTKCYLCGPEGRTLLPFSMRERSHTATSLANLLNSRTWLSSSADHLFTISSIVFPRNMDGGCTAMAVDVAPSAAAMWMSILR